MTSAIQCITLLACMVVCTSADEVMLQCRCPKISKAVKPSLIYDVTEYKPRPYCNKHEIIITLKDKTQRCIDPEGKFAKAVLQTMAMMKAKKLAEKIKTDSSKTETATTTAPVDPPSRN